jgi:2-oxoglutarate dehydrogenase E2 component (dihydrolipoamide succinyltransferase)
MSTEIKVPNLGESVTEATVGQWFKKVGDPVSVDEPLVELETDKVTIEVPASVAGTLQAISAEPGAAVDVGAIIGTIGEGEAAAPASAPAPAEPAAAPAQAETASAMPPSPAAQKRMTESGLDPADVEGSGRRGQILKSDVAGATARAAAMQPAPVAPAPPAQEVTPAQEMAPAQEATPSQEPTPAPQAAPAPAQVAAFAPNEAREERVKMTRLRQTIARRLKDAQNAAAMLTTFNEVDMGPVMELRKQYKELFEKKHGVKLGFMGFFTKAITHALKELPAVNAEIDGDEIIYKNYAHIGVAVGTPKGLVVPVVRDADAMSIAQVETEIGRLGRAARDGQLTIGDMQGGTFTISNGGVYGSLMSTPILNAPQSGILGMHKIQERPVAVDGQVVIKPMMYLALSYDHRIVDGREAVTFLVRVKESLEDPRRLVLDL